VKYPVVLFDVDHTLFDFDASERAAFAAMVEAVEGEFVPEHFAIYKGLNAALWQQVERGEILAGDVRDRRTAQFCAEVGLDADRDQMTRAFLDGLGANGDLYPGVREVLEQLHGTVALGMATNGISVVQRTKMSRVGLDRFFDAGVISDEVGVAKPDPAFFDLLLGQLGDPDRASVLMVGDSLNSDIQGGINAGVATCWYNPHGKPGSAEVQPTYEISDLTQVLRLVLAD